MPKPGDAKNLKQWLSDLETRNVQEIQLGLTRILNVASRLNVLKPSCKIITVTGTNGKGSTVAALEAIYHAAGYRVGVYTSPHLIEFNERIRVNSKPISDEDLCSLFTLIDAARADTVLTFFEMTTLAAYLYFKAQELDILIIEVGIGGRLDATNIIDADLAIITTVDFDHQEFLGTTLEAIGFEKAGILRNHGALVFADSNVPSTVLSEAQKKQVSSYLYNKDYSFIENAEDWSLSFDNQIICLTKPHIQLKSAAAAIVAACILNPSLPVAHDYFNQAMSSLFIPGRLQLVKGEVDVLYDVSHNPQAAKLLAQEVRKLGTKAQTLAVFSALKDKDILGLITPLKDCVTKWYPAQLDNKRASDEKLLRSKFADAEIPVDICYNSPFIAFEAALKQAKTGDLIIVYGSFFTVSHVMTAQHVALEQERFNETGNG